MRRKYKPNVIPLKIRVWLAIAAAFLSLFALAEFATGYTFLPGKRGGVLLSGIPTVMIAVASLALCLAALLTIVDHYDKRPNEHHYRRVKSWCYKATFYLFIGAPFVEILEHILRHKGIGVFPDFHGFARTFTFYSPDLQRFQSYIDPLADMFLAIVGVSILLILLGMVLVKYFPRVPKRYGFLFGAWGFLGFWYVFLVSTVQDFLLGEIATNGVVYSAINEPAKFNAVLLMHFLIAAFMLLASAAFIVGIITKRLKIMDE